MLETLIENFLIELVKLVAENFVSLLLGGAGPLYGLFKSEREQVRQIEMQEENLQRRLQPAGSRPIDKDQFALELTKFHARLTTQWQNNPLREFKKLVKRFRSDLDDLRVAVPKGEPEVQVAFVSYYIAADSLFELATLRKNRSKAFDKPLTAMNTSFSVARKALGLPLSEEAAAQLNRVTEDDYSIIKEVVSYLYPRKAVTREQQALFTSLGVPDAAVG